MEEIEEILARNVKIKSMENIGKTDEQLSVTGCLIPLKSHISSLKCAAIQSHIALAYCNVLSEMDENKENCDTYVDAEDQKREQMNTSKKASEIEKKNISEREENLMKLSEAIQADFKSNQEKVLSLKNKVSILREKEKQYKKLLERKQLLEKEEEDEGCDESEQNLRNRLSQVQETARQCLSAIEASKECMTLLDLELDTVKESSFKWKENLALLMENKDKFSKQNRESDSMKYLTDVIISLSGFRVVNIAANSITIEIQDIRQELTTAEKRSVISLTLRFAELDGQIVVEELKKDAGTFFIKDLVEKVKGTSNLRVFLLEVQKRFHNEANLAKELKTLQERFAIDWVEEKQTVRVMMGKSGQIVCTLKIDSGYPTAGHVSVEGIHGADQRLIFEDTTDESRNLTGWIEYLFVKYGSL